MVIFRVEELGVQGMGGRKRAPELMTILFKVSLRNLGSCYAPKPSYETLYETVYKNDPLELL